MSVNAMNWAGLCRVPGAGDRARAVLDAVAWWAADAGDPNAARAWPPVEIREGQAACWRGIVEIAQRADADPRTVRRILKRFEQAGLISRQRRHRVDGETARRTTDVIYLDLTVDPVHIERDAVQTERRRAAALDARARRAAPAAAPPEDTMPSKGGPEDTMSPGPRGHDVPSVETDLGRTPRGHLAGGPEGIVSGPPEGIVSGRTTDTTYDTGQDTPSSPQPGTAPGLGTPHVDNPAAAVVASPQERRRIAMTALGTSRDRKLPTGAAWRPLRQLSAPAFDGGVERVLAELVDAERVDPGWWEGTREQHKDVWRQVRAELLRQQTAAADQPPAPPPAAAEEVA